MPDTKYRDMAVAMKQLIEKAEAFVETCRQRMEDIPDIPVNEALSNARIMLENYYVDEDYFDEPALLPEWATGINRARTITVGTQLCTKNGLRTGNAVVLGVKENPLDPKQVYWNIRTDIGTHSVLLASEIRSMYYIGPYFINLTK